AETYALKEGVQFAGRKLGIDDQYVKAGVNLVEHRDEAIAAGKRMIDDPEYRKSQLEKGAKEVGEKAARWGAEQLADKMGIDHKYVDVGANIVQHGDEYLAQAKKLGTEEGRKEVVDQAKARIGAEVDKAKARVEAEINKAKTNLEAQADKVRADVEKTVDDLDTALRPPILRA
ncbi:MAG TPA: hypothetical protein VN914_16150, partial [Polyangia bacterium]|nr:hypothetical protein [Polyangia bacterium]